MGATIEEKRSLSLPVKMFIGLVLGAIIGALASAAGFSEWIASISFLGDIFVKLLMLCMYPLILISIMNGISQVTDMRRLRKVGIGFFWYWLFSGLAIGVVGVVLSLVIQPGAGVNMGDASEAAARAEMSFTENLVGWVPRNPFSAMAGGDVLQIVIVAMLFGLVLTAMPESKHKTFLQEGLAAANEWVAAVIATVIKIAPYGVFVMMANLVATVGATTIGSIFKMLLTMYIIFAVIFLVIYPIILTVFCKVNPITFYKRAFPALLMAFSTCSSNATIPVTMKTAKERLGVPEDITDLITAPAATLNMHANCMQTPLYCIFAAQLYNLDLSPSQLFVTIVLGLISTIGAAGVPGGGFLMITLVLQVMGLPLTVTPWIIGIYTLIDMPGTMTNVAGDIVGMTTVASGMGELDRDVLEGRKEVVYATQS